MNFIFLIVTSKVFESETIIIFKIVHCFGLILKIKFVLITFIGKEPTDSISTEYDGSNKQKHQGMEDKTGDK